MVVTPEEEERVFALYTGWKSLYPEPEPDASAPEEARQAWFERFCAFMRHTDTPAYVSFRLPSATPEECRHIADELAAGRAVTVLGANETAVVLLPDRLGEWLEAIDNGNGGT